MTSAEKLFEAGKNKALRLLLFRPRSTAELREKLREKEVSPETIDRVVHWLKERKYLDDRAYAENVARTLAVNRLWGNFRIRLHLREKGISPVLSRRPSRRPARNWARRRRSPNILKKNMEKQANPG